VFFYFDLFILLNRSGILKQYSVVNVRYIYGSLNERTQGISASMKLHKFWGVANAREIY